MGKTKQHNINLKIAAERRRRKTTKKDKDKHGNYVGHKKYKRKTRIDVKKEVKLHEVRLNQEIDNSLNRSLNMAADSERIGANTAEELDRRRYKLKTIHNELAQTQSELKQADEELSHLENWAHILIDPVKKVLKAVGPRPTAKKDIDIKKTKRTKKGKRIKFARSKRSKLQKEQEDKLQELDGFLNTLQAQAQDIGNELEVQDKMIDETQQRIKKADEKAQKFN